MAELTSRKIALLGGLLTVCGDSVLDRLRAALAGSSGHLQQVRDLVEAERWRRHSMALAFGPLMVAGAAHPRLPAGVRDRLWGEVVLLQPGLAELVDDARLGLGACDKLCAVAAGLLRDHPEAWPDIDALELAADLDLVPLTRELPELLPELTARPSDAALARYRGVLRDAQSVHADGAPRLLAILGGRLTERPAHLLRLIALSAPHAHQEAVLAGTELGALVDALLDRAEAAADTYLSLNLGMAADRDVQGAVRDLGFAVSVLSELVLTLALRPKGVWAERQGALRARLAKQAVVDMKAAPAALEEALPLAKVRLVGGMTRFSPDLTADPDAPAMAEAARRLRLFAGLKGVAAVLGCSAQKALAGETLQQRLFDYVEEALERLNHDEVEDRDRTIRLVARAAEMFDHLGTPAMATAARRRLTAARSDPDIVAIPRTRSHHGA